MLVLVLVIGVGVSVGVSVTIYYITHTYIYHIILIIIFQIQVVEVIGYLQLYQEKQFILNLNQSRKYLRVSTIITIITTISNTHSYTNNITLILILSMNLITGEIDTQTEVDEFGVWDKQDGWVLPVTGTVVARARWKKSLKFAHCPSCKGMYVV